jgi:hypothetical protein
MQAGECTLLRARLVDRHEIYNISMKKDSEREVVIFTEAVTLPHHQRKPFLQSRCGRNEYLQQQIEALLKAHDRLGDFLEKPLIPRPTD